MFILIIVCFIIAFTLFIIYLQSMEDKKNNEIRKNEVNDFIENLKELGFIAEKTIISDYGELYIDNTNKQWVINLQNDDDIKIFDYDELLKFEIIEDGSSVASGTAGKAFIGGLLFGATGAIICSAGKNTINDYCTKLELRITTTHFEYIEIILPLIIFKTPKNSLEYKKCIDTARSMATALSYIQNNSVSKEQ